MKKQKFVAYQNTSKVPQVVYGITGLAYEIMPGGMVPVKNKDEEQYWINKLKTSHFFVPVGPGVSLPGPSESSSGSQTGSEKIGTEVSSGTTENAKSESPQTSSIQGQDISIEFTPEPPPASVKGGMGLGAARDRDIATQSIQVPGEPTHQGKPNLDTAGKKVVLSTGGKRKRGRKKVEPKNDAIEPPAIDGDLPAGVGDGYGEE